MSGENSDTDRNYEKPVTTRLTEQTNQKFEEWREDNGYGKTEGARRLINNALDAETGDYELVKRPNTIDARPLRWLSIFAGLLYAGAVLTDRLGFARAVGGVFLSVVAVYAVWPLFQLLRADY